MSFQGVVEDFVFLAQINCSDLLKINITTDRAMYGLISIFQKQYNFKGLNISSIQKFARNDYSIVSICNYC